MQAKSKARAPFVIGRPKVTPAIAALSCAALFFMAAGEARPSQPASEALPRGQGEVAAAQLEGTGAFDRTFVQAQVPTASDRAAGDSFGRFLAASGDTAIIAAPSDTVGGNQGQGSAFIFVRSGENWIFQQKLTASDGAAGDAVVSVAISGDTAIIGTGAGNVGQGAAYVFVRNGSSWTQQQKLTAPDGAEDDRFGAYVAISGNTAVVTAQLADIGANDDQGAAYVFVRNGTAWALQQKLTANEGADGNTLGSVAISGNTAVIGSVNANAAYVFVRNGTTWTQQQRLHPSDVSRTQFGQAVALDGETALIGASWTNANPSVPNSTGAAYVFVRSGATWTQRQVLGASDGGVSWNGFGDAVALSGEMAVIGAYHDSVRGLHAQGSAYVFVRNGTTWAEEDKLTKDDDLSVAWFGASVAISGETPLIGVPGDGVRPELNWAGSVHAFDIAPLTVFKSAAAFVDPGANLTYTLTYENASMQPATNVVIRDPLPAGTTFVSATGGTLQGTTVVFNIGSVPAGSGARTVSFTVNVTAQAGSLISNSAYTVEAGSFPTFEGPPVLTRVNGEPPPHVVSNTNDSGPGSLRGAISDAAAAAANRHAGAPDGTAPPGRIVFDAAAFQTPKTIVLTSGVLAINSDLSITGPGASLLTISGNNASRVFAVDTGRTVSISGVTVRNGNSLTGIFPGNGGGIINRGTMTLSNVVVSDNTCTIRGGGIFNGASGILTVSGATISNNTFGPGHNGSVDGGGIYNNATLSVADSVISGNVVNGDGGGLQTVTGNTSITGSTIGNNTATFAGGGIYLGSGGLVLLDSTISGNTGNGGGGIRGAGGRLDATNVTISDNVSTSGGGGLYSSGVATLTNATVVNNRLTNATAGNGAGIFSGTATLALGNTIVANNITSASATSDLKGFVTSNGHNLFESIFGVTISGTTTGNVTGVDPNLGPLQSNGGRTATHALIAGSPALNAGDDEIAQLTDQRGVARVGVSDIGAYELQGLATVTASSRKVHGTAGTFDINLPLTGAPGVECRSSGGNHTLVFTFTNNLASGSASVTSGVGSVTGTPTRNGNTMTVNLTGVADVQKITVTLSGVTDSSGQVLPNTAVSMNVLIGDINASKVVNASDIGSVKAQSGAPVTAANFRADVVVSGGISASDIGLVKSRSGFSVP